MDWPAMKQLNQKQFDGLSTEIEGYVDAVTRLTQDGDYASIDSLYICAVRFLTKCCSFLADDKAPLDTRLEDAISSCCRVYSKLCYVASVDDARAQSSLKTFLYIVSKLVGKVNPSTFLALSNSVLETLKSVPDLETKAQVCDYIPKFYSFLWNGAITLEHQPDIPALQVYQVRLASLRLLAQLASKRESCLEKLVLAVSVFDYQIRQKCTSSEERTQEEKTQHGRTPSKSRHGNKAKKGSSSLSESAEMRESVSGEGCQQELGLLSELVLALEDIVQGGSVSSTLLIKLILTVYECLANSRLQRPIEELKTKLMTLLEGTPKDDSSSNSSSSQSVCRVLEPVWDLLKVMETVCDEQVHPQISEQDLQTWLTNILSWCEHRHSRTSLATKQSFVELFCWFTRQIKNKKVGSYLFLKQNLLSLLLQVLQEGQNFFAENMSEVMAAGSSDGTSPKKEWQEKVSKTHLDTHRCWLLLYQQAVMDTTPVLMTSAGMERLVRQAEHQLGVYAATINMASHCPSIQHSERYSLGSVCLKLGHVWYNQSRDSEAIVCYTAACTQLRLWCQADLAQLRTRIKESTLLKLHNCLSQSLLKAGRLDEAMTTLRQVVTLAHDLEWTEDELGSVMRTWLRAKRAAVKEGGEVLKERLARCLVMEDQCSAHTVCFYLRLELNCLLKGHSTRQFGGEEALLKRLQALSPETRDRDISRLLLLQLDVLTNHPVHSDREEVEQCLHDIKSKYPKSTLLQMEVHLIRFCLNVKDKLDKPVPEPSDSSPEAIVGPPSLAPHTKMIGEEDKRHVKEALHSWKEGLEERGVEEVVEEEREVVGKMVVMMLMMVADVLRACREFVLQLEVGAVVMVMEKHSSWHSPALRHDATTSILEALTALGVANLPQAMIDAVSHVKGEGLQGKEARPEDKGAEFLSLQLSLGQFYLKAGQVGEWCGLLNSLRDSELRGELGTLHRGKYYRLLYLCLMAHHGSHQDSHQDSCPVDTDSYVLAVVQNAYRSHFSIFSRTESAEGLCASSQGCAFSLWVRLSELLESTLILGRVYFQVGDCKRAKCYLREGLSLSNKFGLLKWSTMFGVELSSIMCDTQSLQPLMNTLSSTYTALSTLEPPHQPRPSHSRLPSSKGKQSRTEKEASTFQMSFDDLAKECEKEYNSRREQILRVWNKAQTDVAVRFWQRVQTYTKMEDEKRVELCSDLAEVTSSILAWTTTLASHPNLCWCPMCTDPEGQYLALSLTLAALEVIHAGANAYLPLEAFFREVLSRMRKVNVSQTVTETLRWAGLIDGGETVVCSNTALLQCVTEMCSLLVESTLHQRQLSQALAYAKAGLKAASHLPPHCPDTAVIRVRLAQLHAVCVHSLLSVHTAQRMGDWRDTWCWLSEAQLEVQISNKLEQLKIAMKGSGNRKAEKSSPQVDPAVNPAGRDSYQDSQELGIQQVSPTEGLQSLGMASGKDSKTTPPGVSPVKESPPSHRSTVEGGKESASHRLHSKGRRLRTAQGVENSTVKMATPAEQPPPYSASKESSQRLAQQQSLSQSCNTAQSNQRSPLPRSHDLTSTQTLLRTEMVCRTNTGRTTDRKGKLCSVQKSAASLKRNQKKKGAALSHTDSSEDPVAENNPVLFTDELVVTRLFSEEIAQNEEGQNEKDSAIRKKDLALKEKESVTGAKGLVLKKEAMNSQKIEKLLLQMPISPRGAVTPRTPSSLIQQTLCFSGNSPSSENDFQPSTPKSTPRMAGWWKCRSSQTKNGSAKDPTGRLSLTNIINSCRPDRSRGSGVRKGTSLRYNSAMPSSPLCEDGSVEVAHTEEKTTATKPGQKTTSRSRRIPREAAVDSSLQDHDNSSPDSKNIALEALPVPVVAKEASSATQRGRRGQGKALTEQSNKENAVDKASTSNKKGRSKVLHPVNILPLETQGDSIEESLKVMLNCITEEPVSVSNDTSMAKGSRMQEDSSSQARKTRQAKVDSDVDTQTEEYRCRSGQRTTNRGRKQNKTTEKPARTRRGAAARTCRDEVLSTVSSDLVPEREVVRAGGDNSPELEATKDVFDFVESDEENQPTSVRKCRKEQFKIPSTKVGRLSKQAAGKVTYSAKARDRSTKFAVLKYKAVPPAASALPRSGLTTALKDRNHNEPSASIHTYTKSAATDSKEISSRRDCRQAGDSRELSLTKDLKEASSAKDSPVADSVSTLNSGLNSIETLRMSDLTSRMETIGLLRDSASYVSVGSGGKGGSGGDGSDISQLCVKHMEEVLLHFHTGENCGEDSVDRLADDMADIALDSREDTLRKVQAVLAESLSLIHHFPKVPVFSETSKLVAQIKLDQAADPWEIAALLSESAAVSLRHQFLAYYYKQVRLTEAEGEEKQGGGRTELKDYLQDLMFPWDLTRYRDVVTSLPQGWTVCQLSVVDSPGNPSLLLTRLTSDHDPITVDLPRFSDDKGQAIYFGFKDILKVNDHVQKIKDSAMWWRHRAMLEAKLANLLEGMEKHWLGSWKGLLAGQTSDVDYNTEMTTAADTLCSILQSHLGLKCSSATARQAVEVLQFTKDIPTVLCHLLNKDDLSRNTPLLSDITTKVISNLPKIKHFDLPVILILDKHLVNFPLEQLGVMRRNQQVTRVPSLPLLDHLLKRHQVARYRRGRGRSLMERGVDPTSVFYLMNPDGDLIKSQEFLDPFFRSNEKWQGIAGTVPTKEQYEQALTQYDLFVYCGHGNGCKYYFLEDLLKTSVRCVPLLFGCASVRLDAAAHLDADAYFYTYLLAGSPCVLGNLWDVTDRDIDTIGLEIFTHWLQGAGEDGTTPTSTQPGPSLPSLLHKARGACRMPWLNGGAPVVYGLPVPLRRPSASS